MALTQPTSVRLKADLRNLVKAESRRTGESMQQVIASAIRAGLTFMAKKGSTK